MVQQAHGVTYWMSALGCALIGGVAACYAGVWSYNRELERMRAAVGPGGFVDGRVPFELPVYIVVGALVGWWLFRATAMQLWRPDDQADVDSHAS
jgi:hypothetical protein